jgi:hypothetical protein
MISLNGSSQSRSLFIVQVINVGGLVALGLVIIPAGSVKTYQFVALVSLLFLMCVLYYLFRRSRDVHAVFFGVSVGVILWITACENIVWLDNLVGTHVSSELGLGLRLELFVRDNLKRQHLSREVCCGDPLSFHYTPGTRCTITYDPRAGNTKPYQTVVDQTGYLNGRHDLLEMGQVGIYMAGDSVMQGHGVSSVVDLLNEVLPLKIWNLSSGRYGPRQKVNALIAYGLPRHPKWLMLDFYSHNDIDDAIRDEICEASGTFQCLFNAVEQRRRALQHPLFSSMVEPESWGLFEDYVSNSFTLAVTRHFIGYLKATIKRSLGDLSAESGRPREILDGREGRPFKVSDISYPGGSEFKLHQDRLFDWLSEGMRLTYARYDRLATETGTLEEPPHIVLIYNPSAYEIYRDVVVAPDLQTDEVSIYQKQALSRYADNHGWRFIDLTPSLHRLAQDGVWLYGRYDRMHWSEEGTAVLASVLAPELIQLISSEEKPLTARS